MSRALVFASVLAVVLAGSSAPLRADNIRLTNGDTIRGKVVSIDEKQITIESETFGKVVLPRAKIAGITLGDGPAPQPAETAAPAPLPNVKIDPKDKPEDIVRKLIPKDFDLKKLSELSAGAKPAANPEDVVRELRAAGGVDPALERQLSSQIPGFTAPQVQSYFNKQVNGLMSGEISLGDVRNDAMDVRDQLQELKKDLGPSGDALDGYLGILNGFIRDTEAVPPKKPRQKPQQTKPRGADRK